MRTKKELKKEIASLEKKIDDLYADLELEKYEKEKIQTMYDGLFREYAAETEKLRKFEIKGLKTQRHAMDLMFLEAEYDKPVLWIQAEDTAVSHGVFANIRDKLKRLCPKIKLIIMTKMGVHLTELDDEQLNKVGLARIVNTKIDADDNMVKLLKDG